MLRHWRITTLPELAPLSPRARRQVVRRYRAGAVESHLMRLGSALIALAIAVCVALALIATGGLYVHSRGSALSLGLACVTVTGALAALCWCLFVRLARWAIRLDLRLACPDGRLPNCPTCDYDLYGSSGDRCPECGEVVRLADENGQPRPPLPPATRISPGPPESCDDSSL